MMQEHDTTEWSKLVERATKAHNTFSHEALTGNADSNGARDSNQTNLQFELREEVGKNMAQQNAVIDINQKNVQENGAV